MNKMSLEKKRNEICGSGKREKARKTYSVPFRLPGNSHGVTETRTWILSDGRRAANRLRHGTANNNFTNIFLIFISTSELSLITQTF